MTPPDTDLTTDTDAQSATPEVKFYSPTQVRNITERLTALERKIDTLNSRVNTMLNVLFALYAEGVTTDEGEG